MPILSKNNEVMSQPELEYWLKEAESCRERQEKELKKNNHYPFLIKYYEGDQNPTESAGGNTKKLAVINNYFPNTNELIASLSFKNIDILAEATRPTAKREDAIIDVEKNSPVMRSALKYAFNKLDGETENKIGVFDMLYAGYSAIEVNHITETEPETAPERSFIGKLSDKIKGNPEQVAEDVEKTLEGDEEKYKLPNDETILRRWNPLDILLDWRAERIKDMRYTIKIIRLSKAEFDARFPKFKDKAKVGDTIPFAKHDREEDKKVVVYYEFQVKKKDGKFDNFLIAPTWKFEVLDRFTRPYTTNGFNVKVSNLHKYGKLYSVSFAQVNKGLQDDINAYMTHMMEVAERNIPKRGYNKGKVKEDGITALNSRYVNDLVPVDGGQENVWAIAHTNVSQENKELLGIFQNHKDKMWSVSASRVEGKSDVKFAEELKIQSEGFQVRQIDIQEGIRNSIIKQLDTLKDIIVQFWDMPVWFKITGGEKPTWYEPVLDPLTGRVLNPLTDLLTGDYEIDIDIASVLRPNPAREKLEHVALLEFLANPAIQQVMMIQGVQISVDFIRSLIRKSGFNPDVALVPFEPPPIGGQ